jgi:hypothetical protein
MSTARAYVVLGRFCTGGHVRDARCMHYLARSCQESSGESGNVAPSGHMLSCRRLGSRHCHRPSMSSKVRLASTSLLLYLFSRVTHRCRMWCISCPWRGVLRHCRHLGLNDRMPVSVTRGPKLWWPCAHINPLWHGLAWPVGVVPLGWPLQLCVRCWSCLWANIRNH